MVITQLFSYWHLYQALGRHLPSAMPQAGQLSTLGLDVWANMKTALITPKYIAGSLYYHCYCILGRLSSRTWNH